MNCRFIYIYTYIYMLFLQYGYLYTWTQDLTIVSISWRCIGYKRTGPWQDQAKAKLLCVQCGSQFSELRFRNVFFQCQTTFDDFWPLRVPRSDLGIVFAWHRPVRRTWISLALWTRGKCSSVVTLSLFSQFCPVNILRFSIPCALWQFVWGIPWIPWLTLHAQGFNSTGNQLLPGIQWAACWGLGWVSRTQVAWALCQCTLNKIEGNPSVLIDLLVFADICVCLIFVLVVWREAWSLIIFFKPIINVLNISYSIAFQKARGCDGLPKLWPGSCKGWEMRCINMHFGTFCKVICRSLDSHCRSM